MRRSTGLPTASTWALLALGLLLSTGCGKKGEPLPPLRYVPQAASDLAARQRGGELVLRMPYPKLATNGYKLPGLASVEVYQLVLPADAAGKAPAVDARQFEPAAKLIRSLRGADLQAATLGDRLEVHLPVPAAEAGAPRTSLTFAVRYLATTGERSVLSNLAQVVPIGAPEPPTDLALEPTREGIVVSWQGSPQAGSFRVYRRLAQEKSYGPALATVPGDAARYADETARFGSRYIYAVTALAKEDPSIESAFAAEREVDYRDRFPPQAPAGLVALTERDRVRLAWEANAEGDLAGYHVYRRSAGGDERLTSAPIAATSFVVSNLVSGQSYTFYVVAVDSQGNESPASAETSITLP